MGKMYEDWNKLFCDQMVEEIKKFEKCPTKEQLCVIKDLIKVTNGLQEMEMAGAIRRIAEDRYGYDSGTGRFREMPMEMMGGMGSYDPELEFFEMFNASRGGRGGGRGRRRDSRGRFIANMANAGGGQYGGNTGGQPGGSSGGSGRGGQTQGVYNNMPYYPYPPDEFGLYGEDMPWYMMPWMNAGREFSGDRFESEEERERMKEEREEMMNAGRGGRGSNRGGSNGGGRGGNRSGGRSSGGSSGGRGERSGGSYNAYPNGQQDDDEMYMLRQENGMPIMTPYNMSHDIPKKLTDEQCEEWMESIVNFDGSDGPKWTKPQIEAEAKRAGIDISKFSLPLISAVTNAMYADYGDVAKTYNCDKPSFYIRMAEAFLDDEDFSGNPEEKASIYFHKIVEHE